MNEYRVFYDEKYILEGLSQYRGQRKVYPWFVAVKAICFLGLAALLAIIVAVAVRPARGETSGLILIALVPGFFMFLLALGPRIDHFFIKRRLKQSPFYGGETSIAVAEAGVEVKTPKSQAALSWAAFTKAKRLANGFLVTSEPGSFHWWPDSALMTGAPGDVERLLSKNIASYERQDA